ncbi:MAG: GNAT family N-acetyltransferase [Bacteroidetes bacterium]|nr:GNAT family N-acetyltransferase [Bacteroidota bacterium]
MSDSYNINYVRHESIDQEKWDRCIAHSNNELIYGYSTFLNHMAKNWDGLILDDYDAVMPLTWNQKWGIKYLYQPPLTQQLGIFSSKGIHESLISAFIKKINSNFKFAEIFFNYSNPHPLFKPHDNYILNVEKPYIELAANYKKDLQKNLKRSSRFQLNYTATYDLLKALRLHQEKYKHTTPHTRSKDYANFEKLCIDLAKKKEILTRAVLDENNYLLSVAVLLKKNTRIYLIETSTTDEGRKMQAHHFLLDAMIREFAGMNLTIDFVGSDISGIADFYKNFNPSNQSYFFYYHNELPWPLKYFK